MILIGGEVGGSFAGVGSGYLGDQGGSGRERFGLFGGHGRARRASGCCRGSRRTGSPRARRPVGSRRPDLPGSPFDLYTVAESRDGPGEDGVDLLGRAQLHVWIVVLLLRGRTDDRRASIPLCTHPAILSDHGRVPRSLRRHP
jgi:hypothetical protein